MQQQVFPLLTPAFGPIGNGFALFIAVCAIAPAFLAKSVYGLSHTANCETGRARETLKLLARRPVRLEKEERLESIRQRDEEHQVTMLYKHDWLREPIPELQPTYGEIDEADRLRSRGLKMP